MRVYTQNIIDDLLLSAAVAHIFVAIRADRHCFVVMVILSAFRVILIAACSTYALAVEFVGPTETNTTHRTPVYMVGVNVSFIVIPCHVMPFAPVMFTLYSAFRAEAVFPPVMVAFFFFFAAVYADAIAVIIMGDLFNDAFIAARCAVGSGPIGAGDSVLT